MPTTYDGTPLAPIATDLRRVLDKLAASVASLLDGLPQYPSPRWRDAHAELGAALESLLDASQAMTDVIDAKVVVPVAPVMRLT